MKYMILVAVLLMAPVFPELSAQAVSQPRAGAPGSWRVLGTVQARFTADHDVITVAGPYDQFRKIKFKVTDAPLDITHMVVVYENGDRQPVETRLSIPKGGESRVIDLVGTQRRLKRVEFWYDTRGRGQGKADLTLLGMK
jgi:hypothetical protein